MSPSIQDGSSHKQEEGNRVTEAESAVPRQKDATALEDEPLGRFNSSLSAVQVNTDVRHSVRRWTNFGERMREEGKARARG